MGCIDVTVFGFHIDLDMRMIRSQVTLTAGLWLSGLHQGKEMAGVTTGAGS
jgi:hypothetical protein